ncbi:nicotinate-nucleotide adenylyltransferase [Candidatus Puniceispirillum marinum]|nr:nicotinate-nucleotide adenylyltransferase [Candidatus Puniceispirillum marinum]
MATHVREVPKAPLPAIFHSKTRLKIGLLGGSFNPAHAGHLHMSMLALRTLGLDQIWWLVTPQNPLKDRHVMMTLAHRRDFARTVTAHHPQIKVLSPEEQRPDHLTYNTLKWLKQTCPHAQFIWIMGADNMVQFSAWYRYREISRLMPMAVIDRPGFSYQAISAGRKLPAQRLQPARMAGLLAQRRLARASWCFIAGKRHKASATALRAVIAPIPIGRLAIN